MPEETNIAYVTVGDFTDFQVSAGSTKLVLGSNVKTS